MTKGALRAALAGWAERSALRRVTEETSQVELTVLTVNWNGDPFIRKCLREVALLTRRSHRHVVWDNGSGDGSAEWLAASPHGAMVIQSRRNIKHDAPLQVLSRVVRSRWMAVLDSDAWPTVEGWEETLIDALARPGVRIAGALSGWDSWGLPHLVVHPWLLACETAWGRRRNWLKAGAGYAWDTGQAPSLAAGPEGMVGFGIEAVEPGSPYTRGAVVPGLAFHQFCGSQYHKAGGKAKVNEVPRDVWERNRAELWAELADTPDGT